MISGYQEDRVYHAGERVTLSCATSGGTPPPQLVWTKRAPAHPESVGAHEWVRIGESHSRSSAEQPNETRSDVVLVLAKEDNHVEFCCEVIASSRRRDVFNASVRLQVGCTHALTATALLMLMQMSAHTHCSSSVVTYSYSASSRQSTTRPRNVSGQLSGPPSASLAANTRLGSAERSDPIRRQVQDSGAFIHSLTICVPTSA